MRNIARHLVALSFGILPLQASAQNVVVIERTERWTVVEYNTVLKASYQKVLPDGYMHFTPVAHQVRVKSDGAVICREMANAISFGKRLWLGYAWDEAVDDMQEQRGGDVACGYKAGLQLTSLEAAIRGDDAGRRIFLIKWRDQYGYEHYTGVPCRNNRNCTQ